MFDQLIAEGGPSLCLGCLGVMVIQIKNAKLGMSLDQSLSCVRGLPGQLRQRCTQTSVSKIIGMEWSHDLVHFVSNIWRLNICLRGTLKESDQTSAQASASSCFSPYDAWGIFPFLGEEEIEVNNFLTCFWWVESKDG